MNQEYTGQSVEHVYVHIPFCPQLCDYCSFYSETGDVKRINRFLDALIAEAQIASEKMKINPRTIFFGGGTPSALSVSQFDKLLNAFAGIFKGFEGVEEFTIEMNPATVSLDKARLLKSYGVNRISMGVQAFDDETLKMLNRVHDSAEVIKSFAILRQAGFTNINLDLMFSVPGQTMSQWLDTLKRTLDLGPEHLSCYCLTYEEDTEFWNRLQAGKYFVNEELEAEMFVQTRRILEEDYGYSQYEISNYARDGFFCRHNMAYWQGKDYLGLGPSAFGTLRHLRYQNVAHTDSYSQRIETMGSAVEFTEELSPRVRQRERLMFSLRTSQGIPADELDSYHEQIIPFLEKGWLEQSNGKIALSGEGRLFADEIALIFAE